MIRSALGALAPTLLAAAFGFGLTACGDEGSGNGGVTATCSDRIRNQDEIDVDCGGSCGACPIGSVCEGPSDCVSGQCDNGQCVAAPSCNDRVRNGAETDVDCGGGACGRCEQGDACGTDDDCTTTICQGGVCAAPTCTDGRQNGGETGTDCGGVCPVCPAGEGCNNPQDCASGSCVEGTCAAPACDDAVLNGDEVGVDCGGSCPGCPVGGPCDADEDCASGVCNTPRNECAAASCEDGRQNQDESDIDCGGTICDACPNGAACTAPEDCVDGICTDNTCVAATCEDASQNGRETDVDCGGPICASCTAGQGCELSRDCTSGVCNAMTLTCDEPTCEDGIRNGEEADIDCGGTCGGCEVGQFCAADADCLSGVCDEVNLTCREPSCQDATQNQDETDRDCGGLICGPCADGFGCLVDADCLSLLCNATSFTCDPSSCTDGIRNGLETGVDCGGPACPACPDFFDDFETGTISNDYVMSGNADWLAATRNAINGTYSAESGNISDGQDSIMELTVTVGAAGSVTFEWEVSSETNFDFLEFDIDGVNRLRRSGSVSGTFTQTLSAGTHTLTWEYNKDGSVSSLDDAARIDDLDIQDGGP